MKARAFQTIVVLAILSILGISVTQVFWFRKAFDLKENEFNQTVSVALQTVGEFIIDINKQPVPLTSLVNQLSGDYFVVQINGEIDIRLLEFLLKTEFQKRNIKQDFEYGIYNCETKKMVYGNYIPADTLSPNVVRQTRELPVWRKDNFYFGVYFPHRDGTIISQMGIWLFSSAVMLFVCVFFAITLFYIFRQKQLSEIQKDFINNITHEFKTPLSTIKISAELLNNKAIYAAPEQVMKYTTIIQDEVNRLKEQVESVLQIAAFDKEKVAFKMEKNDFNACVRNAVASIELMAQQKNGNIHVHLAENTTPISMDKLHIMNVIHNLLENAIKYTPEAPNVVISSQWDDKGVTLSVKDNGIGIHTEHQKKIFDRFFRVPTGNVHNVKGFGLGLYYAHKVMEAHKGKISVESEEGKGSTFKLWLPLGL